MTDVRITAAQFLADAKPAQPSAVPNSKTGNAYTTEQQPQEAIAIALPSSEEKMVFLKMHGMLRRNLLINTSKHELEECQRDITLYCTENRMIVRPQFNTMYQLCVKKDEEIHSSYQLFPGTAGEWQHFRQMCVCLMVMRHVLFQSPFETVSFDQGDEEAIEQEVVKLRAKGSSARLFEMTDFSKLNPEGSYYIRVPASVLRWNNKLIFKGKVAATAYYEAAQRYNYDRSAAVAAYTQLLETCKALDNEVTYMDSKYSDTTPKWNSFRDSYIQLSALQLFLYTKHEYNPFEATCKHTADVERSPAARKHPARLQLTSPTHTSKVMPVACDHTAVTESVKSDDTIYTKRNSRGYLYIEGDEILWKQGPFTINSAVIEWQGVPCTRVQPDDTFEFHLSGLLPGKVCRLQIDGDLLLTVLDKDQLHNSTQSELQELQCELQGTNFEQLGDLAMIGVPEAVSKYDEFRDNCVRYLILQYFLLGTPIAIAADADNKPLACQQILKRSSSSLAEQLNPRGFDCATVVRGRHQQIKTPFMGLAPSVQQLHAATKYVNAALQHLNKAATAVNEIAWRAHQKTKKKQYSSKR